MPVKQMIQTNTLINCEGGFVKSPFHFISRSLDYSCQWLNLEEHKLGKQIDFDEDCTCL